MSMTEHEREVIARYEQELARPAHARLWTSGLARAERWRRSPLAPATVLATVLAAVLVAPRVAAPVPERPWLLLVPVAAAVAVQVAGRCLGRLLHRRARRHGRRGRRSAA